MTKFLDGPAAGKTLSLARAPLCLRVVIAPDGTIDALDRLDDAPAPEETIHAYRLHGRAGSVHLDYTDRRTGRRKGKTLAYAEYALAAVQPDDATARDTAAWRAWCVEQKEKQA